MVRSSAAAGLALSVFLIGCGGERGIQRALNKGTGVVTLPPGTTLITRELVVPPESADLEIVGSENTVLKAAPEFQGRAVLYIDGGRRIRLRNFTIDGSRSELERPVEIPPAATPFLMHFFSNGVAIRGGSEVTISGVQFREVQNMAVLAHGVKKILVEKSLVEDSGSHNGKGRNNTTGGFLFEEGTEDFEVRDCVFRRILGNAVWTHSTYQSPRNYRGRFTGNRFDVIGRDAIQVGHANQVRVENNTGKFIGYPHNVVDVEGGGTPVGIDTAGKVDETIYTGNRFEEINGKCIDLDGFHDGEVSRNTCLNRGKPDDYPHGHYGLVMNNANPDMESASILVRENVFDGTKFGGIFVIGRNHQITGNKLKNINMAQCNESGSQFGCTTHGGDRNLLQAGIFLGLRAERVSPARDNLIEDNEISGHRMKERCVLTAETLLPGGNKVQNNRCLDGE